MSENGIGSTYLATASFEDGNIGQLIRIEDIAYVYKPDDEDTEVVFMLSSYNFKITWNYENKEERDKQFENILEVITDKCAIL